MGLTAFWNLGRVGVCSPLSGAVLTPHNTQPKPFYPLPHLAHLLFPLTAPPTYSSHFHYDVSGFIDIGIDLLQFPVHLRRCSQSVREKDKEGPSRPSPRRTITSLQHPQ